MSKLILSVMLLCIVSNAFAKDNNFLEENISENSVEVFLEPKLFSTSDEFAEGFMKGFGFFYDLPGLEDCKPNDPQIIQDIFDIVNILTSVDGHSHFKEILEEVLSKGKDAYERISNASAACKQVAEEAKPLLEKLVKHVSGYTYYAKLALHTTENISTIKEKYISIEAASDAGKFEDAGFAIGDLAKFTFFWNFQPDVFMPVEIEEAINPTDLVLLIKNIMVPASREEN